MHNKNSEIIDTTGPVKIGILSEVPLNIDLMSLPLKSCPSILKKYRLKEWHFIHFYQEEHYITLGIVDLHYISLAFFSYSNFKKNIHITKDIKSPLALGTRFASNSILGRSTFKCKTFELEIKGMHHYFSVNLKLDDYANNIKFNINIERSPAGHFFVHPLDKLDENRISFVHKENLNKINGTGNVNGSEIIFANDNSFGSIDFTKGYLLRQTKWSWASFSGKLRDSRKIGINLSSHIYDNENGESIENYLVINDKKYLLGKSLFKIPEKPMTDPWEITVEPLSNDSEVTNIRLFFSPLAGRSEKNNFIIIKNYFYQPIGTFEGEITLKNEKIKIERIPGIAEKHFALW